MKRKKAYVVYIGEQDTADDIIDLYPGILAKEDAVNAFEEDYGDGYSLWEYDMKNVTLTNGRAISQ